MWVSDRGVVGCGDWNAGACEVTARSQEDSQCAELEGQKGMDQWGEELRELVRMREIDF